MKASVTGRWLVLAVLLALGVTLLAGWRPPPPGACRVAEVVCRLPPPGVRPDAPRFELRPLLPVRGVVWPTPLVVPLPAGAR